MLGLSILSLIAALAFILVGCVVLQTIPPIRSSRISTDYLLLRKNFREAAQARGAQLESHVIGDATDLNGTATIDVAWIGEQRPDKALLHICGTHGVEGYTGSTIQTSILQGDLTVEPGTALIFIHGLNPWGMQNFRRVNPGNVDLNRNCSCDPASFKGAPEGYRLIEPFLNPKRRPRRFDLFYIMTVFNIAKHGFSALKQAIAGGQYEYSAGLYYGGERRERESSFIFAFASERLASLQELYVIDVHSGLGGWGKEILFWPYDLSHEKTQRLSDKVKLELTSDAPESGVGFKTAGDLQNEVPRILPNTETYWLLQEFGAYGPVRTLRALRDENAYHQSGGTDATHWSKRMLLESFCPGDDQWQCSVLTLGRELFTKIHAAMSRK